MDKFIFVDEDNEHWKTISSIAKQDTSHHLWQNYQNFNLSEYEYMVVQLRDDKPISFHGIYNNGRWPQNVSRVCNRLYTVPEHRDILCTTTGDAIKFACDNYDFWGKDVLMISRGCQYDDIETTYKKFQLSVRWCNKYTGYKWEFDGRLYKCCNNESKDCYQFVLWYDPKQIRYSLNIKSISRQDWLLLDEDTCV
jgi:hypothetical protein